MTGPRDAIEAQLKRTAEELVERQRTVHERVACPRCNAPIGERCHKLGSKIDYLGRRRPLAPPVPCKHPHAERLRADGMPLR